MLIALIALAVVAGVGALATAINPIKQHLHVIAVDGQLVTSGGWRKLTRPTK